MCVCVCVCVCFTAKVGDKKEKEGRRVGEEKGRCVWCVGGGEGRNQTTKVHRKRCILFNEAKGGVSVVVVCAFNDGWSTIPMYINTHILICIYMYIYVYKSSYHNPSLCLSFTVLRPMSPTHSFIHCPSSSSSSSYSNCHSYPPPSHIL